MTGSKNFLRKTTHTHYYKPEILSSTHSNSQFFLDLEFSRITESNESIWPVQYLPFRTSRDSCATPFIEHILVLNLTLFASYLFKTFLQQGTQHSMIKEEEVLQYEIENMINYNITSRCYEEKGLFILEFGVQLNTWFLFLRIFIIYTRKSSRDNESYRKIFISSQAQNFWNKIHEQLYRPAISQFWCKWTTAGSLWNDLFHRDYL